MYRICRLGNFDYPYNPPENQNPGVREVAVTQTLSGRHYTDWGQDASRREIAQKWPVIDAVFFDALSAMVTTGGTLPFIDDDEVQYTVIALPPTYQRKTPGGEAYMDVSFKLLVVSSP